MLKCCFKLPLWVCSLLFLLGSATAYGNEYIGCPSEFIRYHQDENLGDGVFYKYQSRFSDNNWHQASVRRANEITVSEFETGTPIETIFYTAAPTEKNYYLIKSGKISDTYTYENTALLGYGDALKRALRSEFSKRFNRPPFNADLVAEIDLDTYQGLHLSNLPSGSSLVSKSRDLFDKKRGWHLTFPDGNSTFKDISARDNFAFPANISEPGQAQKHILEAVLQRYQGPGRACVRIYRTLGSDHTGLFLAFNNTLSNAAPISVNFTLNFQ